VGSGQAGGAGKSRQALAQPGAQSRRGGRAAGQDSSIASHRTRGLHPARPRALIPACTAARQCGRQRVHPVGAVAARIISIPPPSRGARATPAARGVIGSRRGGAPLHPPSAWWWDKTTRGRSMAVSRGEEQKDVLSAVRAAGRWRASTTTASARWFAHRAAGRPSQASIGIVHKFVNYGQGWKARLILLHGEKLTYFKVGGRGARAPGMCTASAIALPAARAALAARLASPHLLGRASLREGAAPRAPGADAPSRTRIDRRARRPRRRRRSALQVDDDVVQQLLSNLPASADVRVVTAHDRLHKEVLLR
jgi:hypothetical protein